MVLNTMHGENGSRASQCVLVQEWLLGVLEAVVQQQEVDHLHR